MPFVKRKLGKSKGEDGYGQGKATIAFGDDVLLDEDAMVETLLACLEAPDYQPPTLPTVAVDLMSLSQQADVDLSDVAKLLEKDPMIAGRILKLVGSAVYSGAQKISSLHEALVRLGLRTLRDIVMEIALNMKVFRSDDYSDTMELLRVHASTTAHMSKVVCKYTAIEGEFAFMAGLLHDVGIAGTLLALSDRKGRRKKAPELISIWPAVDRVHQRAGQLMAEQWQLPIDLQYAISAHHQVLVDGHAHPLAATVSLANDLAHELGSGVVPKLDDQVEEMSEVEKACLVSHTNVDRCGEKTLARAAEALGIGEPQIENIRRDGIELVNQLAGT